MLLGGAETVKDNIVPTVYAEAPQVIEEPIPPMIEHNNDTLINCNCYVYIKSKIPDFPMTKDLKSNTIYPSVRGVVVMDYDGIPHYAFIESVTETGINVSQTNIPSCEYSEKHLTWQYLTDHNSWFWRQ